MSTCPQFIEIIGLPAAGKSSLVTEICNDYYASFDLLYPFSGRTSVSRMKNFSCILRSAPFYFAPKYTKMRHLIYKWMFSEIGINRTSIFYMIVSVSLLMESRRIIRSTICEQGFFQHIISVLFDKHLVENECVLNIVREVFRLMPNYKIVFLNTPVDVVSNRLLRRKHGGSRLDKMIRDDYDNAMDLLCTQNLNLKKIFRNVPEKNRFELDGSVALTEIKKKLLIQIV